MDESAVQSGRASENMPAAARRALAEAEARRLTAERQTREAPKEINGRNGPDPARYGDWEKKGIAVDF